MKKKASVVMSVSAPTIVGSAECCDLGLSFVNSPQHRKAEFHMEEPNRSHGDRKEAG